MFNVWNVFLTDSLVIKHYLSTLIGSSRFFCAILPKARPISFELNDDFGYEFYAVLLVFLSNAILNFRCHN